ncbi:MAG: TonB-dependent receptor, partial [Bacteroidota bacterium]|nr:TonB-dependent receptor [Bacteroidota bacterium]
LMVTYVGYDTIQMSVIIKKNVIKNQNLFLKQGAVQLEEFIVSAERQEMRTEVRTSLIKISPKQLSRIPSIGAEPDLAQYLQIIPGVIFTGDQGGQLYIRGGSPIQNKVLLDGLVIFNPFHSIGLFSVFDSDIIRNADIYTGGFSAEYGGRISSVMDITTRDGNKKRLAGKLSSTPFGSKILLEGPLQKYKESNRGSISYILSAKTSYLDKSSKHIYSYIDEDGLPYSFTDLYGKLSINSAYGSKVNLFGFNFSDRVNYKQVSDLHWNSSGFGGNFILVPGGSPVLIKANFSYSQYEITFKEETRDPSFSMINSYRLGLDFVYFLGNNEFDYGIETMGHTTGFEFYNAIGRKLGRDEPESTTELAGYVKYKYNSGKLLLEPSFRLQYYSSLGILSPEPRLGAKYNVNDNLRIKFAGGLFTQNIVSAVSERDVVNLFYGFLSGNFDLQDEFEGTEITQDLQKSQHLILGFEYDLSEHLMLQIEGYLKTNPQLIILNRNKIYEDTRTNEDKDDYFKKDFIIEQGDAYGIDFLMKYDYKRTYLWFVYSLGKVTRNDGVYDYAPHFDRRHNINLVASHKFGQDLDWEFSARLNLGSGFPTRQNQAMFEQLTFVDGIGTDYTTSNGIIGILYTDIDDKEILPTYHRLDITLKKMFYVGENSELQAMISITNVYNRNNIFYIDRITNQRINQLPIMPSFGLSYKF